MSSQNEIITQAEASCSDTPPSLDGFKESPTAKRVPRAARLLSALLLLIAVAAAVGGGLLIGSHTSSWLALAAFVTSAFFFISGVVVPLGVIREGSLETEEKESCLKDCKDLYWALERIEDHTLKGLAWINFKQLRTFAVIAQRQARMSYYASLVAAAISFLVLTSGAAVAIGLPTTTAKVAAGALATAGTVLSGFFVKTFLNAYQMASSQMSYYYGQPLVHCYLLHAERLAREAGEHVGDEAELCLWQEVIDASIKASADAQDHLFSMQMLNSQEARQRFGPSPKMPRPEQAPQQPPMPDKVDSLPGSSREMA